MERRRPGGGDSEIFVADAAQPIGESIALFPLTNPCQLTNDEADDVAPIRSDGWIVWQRKDLPGSDRSLWFSDGAGVTAVPGSVEPNDFPYTSPAALSGSRLVWWGTDGAGSDGIFLADLAQPLAMGATSLCPLTNPCRIAAAPVTSYADTGPAIVGARVVWSARTGVGEDLEVQFFDAAKPADAAPLLACPLSNPCLLTANDRADAAPIVSASLIVWTQCENADCGSVSPDRVVFDTGAETIEVVGDWSVAPSAIGGSQVAWKPFLRGVVLVDTAEPIDVAPGGYPFDCPLSNPCFLDATGPVQMAGPLLLSSNATDLPGPIDLRLFDLRRPLDPRPFSACPGTNPCGVVEEVEYTTGLSREAIAWLECPLGAGGCEYPYAGSFDLYVVPEPDGPVAAAAAIASLLGALYERKRRHIQLI